jgi:hypothetical protein
MTGLYRDRLVSEVEQTVFRSLWSTGRRFADDVRSQRESFNYLFERPGFVYGVVHVNGQKVDAADVILGAALCPRTDRVHYCLTVSD